MRNDERDARATLLSTLVPGLAHAVVSIALNRSLPRAVTAGLRVGRDGPQPFTRTSMRRIAVRRGHDADGPWVLEVLPCRSEGRRYLTGMRTTISTKGQIVLPSEFRKRDGIAPGDTFEVERLDRGEYRIVRRGPSRAGLVEWLRACPEKGYFVPIESESTG